jgi:hypothetical protein
MIESFVNREVITHSSERNPSLNIREGHRTLVQHVLEIGEPQEMGRNTSRKNERERNEKKEKKREKKAARREASREQTDQEVQTSEGQKTE